MNLSIITSFIFTAIRVATPLIYGALAVCITKQAGLLNMATESMMLSGALCGVLASGYTQSLVLGVLGGMVGGILIGLLISYAAFVCKTDLWMTCIAVNTALVGGTILVMYMITGQKTNTLGYIPSLVMPAVEIPLIKDIPVIGPILSGHNLFTYLSLVLLAAEWFLLYRTKIGLRIRAVGQNPQAAESVGIAPRKLYFISFIFSGIFASLGGMFMSMGYLQWFARDMMAGRGHIAMSAATIAGGNPVIANILLDHLNKLVLAGEPSAVIAFPFQDAPEALHRAVVNAMRHAGHTLRHARLHKLVVEGTVGVLKPSVAVEQRMRVRIGLHSLVEGFENQWVIVVFTEHVGHNAPVAEV